MNISIIRITKVILQFKSSKDKSSISLKHIVKYVDKSKCYVPTTLLVQEKGSFSRFVWLTSNLVFNKLTFIQYTSSYFTKINLKGNESNLVLLEVILIF